MIARLPRSIRFCGSLLREQSFLDQFALLFLNRCGYNPWGLVWLFEEFQNADPKQIPQLLSDHPANGTRIRTLKEHFRDNPSVFAKFNSRPESASPFVLPKDASERFLRP